MHRASAALLGVRVAGPPPLSWHEHLATCNMGCHLDDVHCHGCAQVLTGVVEKHQQARAAVSEDDVRHFMAVRRMTCPGAHADITSDRAGVVMRPGLICCDLEGSTWQYSVAGAD